MLKIQNAAQLAITPLRKAALEIAEAGLQAIDTQYIIEKGVRVDTNNALHIGDEVFSLEGVQRLFVVGVGKCAFRAVEALEKVLGDRIADGVVLDVQFGKLERVRSLLGDHPFPTDRNMQATAEIIQLLSETREDDLVLFVVSGGGSTLLCQPESMKCEEEQGILDCLFRAGATIQEINTLRKHLSYARGGNLAKYAYPAQVVSLIFSDVPGDGIESISSGPTVVDTTRKEDAQKVLDRYKVAETCGFRSIELLETPKDAKYFENVRNILFVSNKTALEAMREKAEQLGFNTHVPSAELTGEARDVAKYLAEELHKAPGKSVLLYGGETTVTVKNPGKGGRNLELALSALRFVQEGEIVMTVASDGRDNTEYAGAIADFVAKEHAAAKKLDIEKYLNGNQSFVFFEQTGDYLFTDSTGSNVSDFIITIKQ